MEDVKSFLASRTIWGGLIALGSTLLGVWGYTVDADAQGQLVEIVSSVGTAIGSLIAIYGRVKATKAIG